MTKQNNFDPQKVPIKEHHFELSQVKIFRHWPTRCETFNYRWGNFERFRSKLQRLVQVVCINDDFNLLPLSKRRLFKSKQRRLWLKLEGLNEIILIPFFIPRFVLIPQLFWYGNEIQGLAFDWKLKRVAKTNLVSELFMSRFSYCFDFVFLYAQSKSWHFSGSKTFLMVSGAKFRYFDMQVLRQFVPMFFWSLAKHNKGCLDIVSVTLI